MDEFAGYIGAHPATAYAAAPLASCGRHTPRLAIQSMSGPARRIFTSWFGVRPGGARNRADPAAARAERSA